MNPILPDPREPSVGPDDPVGCDPSALPAPPRPDALEGENVSVLEGRFAFVQAARGWRFGSDAVMLARHVFDGPQGDLLEIGTGCGVVPVLLAGWGWQGSITAIEVQPDLADRARRNVVANGCGSAVAIVEGDARRHRDLLPPGTFARVIANPPYWRLGSGRTNPHPERAVARHEFLLDVPSLLAIIRDRVAPGGLATVLYPPERMPDLRGAVDAAGLSVVRTVDLIPAPGRPAEVVLIDIAPGRGLPRAASSWCLIGRT